jgi:hypothetical protein
MNEINIQDKVFDAITVAIKKMNIFEKTEKIKNICYGFAICGSIISIFTLYNTYSTLKIKDKMDELERRMDFYNKQTSNIAQNILDTNIKLQKNFFLLDEMKLENKTYNQEMINIIKYNKENINNKEENINNKEENINEEEEECLLEEYYDVRRYTL